MAINKKKKTQMNETMLLPDNDMMTATSADLSIIFYKFVLPMGKKI